MATLARLDKKRKGQDPGNNGRRIKGAGRGGEGRGTPGTAGQTAGQQQTIPKWKLNNPQFLYPLLMGTM